jgi:heterodisulfide reductase subunit C2
MTKFNMVTASPAKAKGTPVTPDSSFQQLVQDHGADKISLCFQCRKCSSGCPLGFAMDYLPDVILRMVRLGMKDRVLNSKTIWLCASCETCTTRCPNEIDIAGVMDTLRHISVTEGKISPQMKNVPILHKAFLGSIEANGRVHETGMITDYILKSNPFTKITNGELIDQAKLGWDMMRRGKLNIRPRKIRNTEEVKKAFAKSKK